MRPVTARLLPIVALLADCTQIPELAYVQRNYAGVEPLVYEVAGYRYRLQQHPTDPRLLGAPVTGAAIREGASDSGSVFRLSQAVNQHIRSLGDCRILDRRAILEPTWEYLYACD